MFNHLLFNFNCFFSNYFSGKCFICCFIGNLFADFKFFEYGFFDDYFSNTFFIGFSLVFFAFEFKYNGFSFGTLHQKRYFAFCVIEGVFSFINRKSRG